MNDIKELKEKGLENVSGGVPIVTVRGTGIEHESIQCPTCKCDICNATFSDNTALIQHKASAHNSYEKEAVK